MTKDCAELIAVGLIAILLALVSLGTAKNVRWPNNSVEEKLAAPASDISRRATPRYVRALREGHSIDLNHATVADLELLPGIGPKLAQRIVADRKRNGSYRNIGDLTRVSGIGPVKLTRIERLLTISDSDAKK